MISVRKIEGGIFSSDKKLNYSKSNLMMEFSVFREDAKLGQKFFKVNKNN